MAALKPTPPNLSIKSLTTYQLLGTLILDQGCFPLDLAPLRA